MANSPFKPKSRYELLDGLRGTAALCVIVYHFFEAWATSAVDQHFNHGYLAVDFFFILSGFVISYAYDDRWKEGLTVGAFFKRRLIRLHPMVIMGVVIGVVAFIVQGCTKWDGTKVGVWAIVLATLLNLLLLPAVPGTMPEVRGNGEMYPLNGPNWSLFFEYIGNIFYALFIRLMSTKVLKVFTAILGVLLAAFAVGNLSGAHHIGVGWTMAEWNLPGGLLRMTFSYCMGMVIARTFKKRSIPHAFLLCSLILVALFAVPHIGGDGPLGWLNGVYDILCVGVLFPAVLYMGACGHTGEGFGGKACKFLGEISYPLYVVHYPLMYLYYHHIWEHNLTIVQSIPLMIAVLAGSILLAYITMRFWDGPIRKKLSSRGIAQGK